MTAAAEFRVVEDGEVCVGSLSGEVDVSNAADVGEEITSAISNDHAGLILDLSDLRYLDSSGVGLLFGLVRSLGSRRQRLVLVVPESSPLNRVLDITRLSATASVALTRTDAKQRVRGPEADPRPTPS